MKIDFIYDCVYPFSKGGGEKRIASYAEILRDAGCDVKYVSMNWWGDHATETTDQLQKFACCPKLRLYKKDGNRSIFASFVFGVTVFWYVWRRCDADIIDSEIFPYFPIIFARMAVMCRRKKPIIIGYWSEYLGEEYWRKHFGILWRVGVILEYLSFVSCDRIVANSAFTQKRLRKKFHKKNKLIDMISPASIDMTLIDRVPAQEKIHDIIYYGRIIWHKHVEHVVDVVEALVKNGYPAQALIIGDGPDADKIADMITKKRLEKHIVRCDFVEHYDDLIARIKSARVMIQPSEREGFGITVVEANACGLPVFVVDYPDNAAKELIINDVNGFVCKDHADLLKRVSAFFTDAGSRENLAELSQRSIDASRPYAKERIAKQVRDHYM